LPRARHGVRLEIVERDLDLLARNRVRSWSSESDLLQEAVSVCPSTEKMVPHRIDTMNSQKCPKSTPNNLALGVINKYRLQLFLKSTPNLFAHPKHAGPGEFWPGPRAPRQTPKSTARDIFRRFRRPCVPFASAPWPLLHCLPPQMSCWSNLTRPSSRRRLTYCRLLRSRWHPACSAIAVRLSTCSGFDLLVARRPERPGFFFWRRGVLGRGRCCWRKKYQTAGPHMDDTAGIQFFRS
jgi:hypothetical protein